MKEGRAYLFELIIAGSREVNNSKHPTNPQYCDNGRNLHQYTWNKSDLKTPAHLLPTPTGQVQRSKLVLILLYNSNSKWWKILQCIELSTHCKDRTANYGSLIICYFLQLPAAPIMIFMDRSLRKFKSCKTQTVSVCSGERINHKTLSHLTKTNYLEWWKPGWMREREREGGEREGEKEDEKDQERKGVHYTIHTQYRLNTHRLSE